MDLGFIVLVRPKDQLPMVFKVDIISRDPQRGNALVRLNQIDVNNAGLEFDLPDWVGNDDQGDEKRAIDITRISPTSADALQAFRNRTYLTIRNMEHEVVSLYKQMEAAGKQLLIVG